MCSTLCVLLHCVFWNTWQKLQEFWYLHQANKPPILLLAFSNFAMVVLNYCQTMSKQGSFFFFLAASCKGGVQYRASLWSLLRQQKVRYTEHLWHIQHTAVPHLLPLLVGVPCNVIRESFSIGLLLCSKAFKGLRTVSVRPTLSSCNSTYLF